MIKYKCDNCGIMSAVHPVKVGRILDDAYGHPKWFDNYQQRTICCNAEFLPSTETETEEKTE